MKIEVLLICEDPEYGLRGHRKMWYASYSGDDVQVCWGRIDPGRAFKAETLHLYAKQKQRRAVKSDEEALDFIQKMVSEKTKKGYNTVRNEIDGIPFTFGETDSRGYITMKTFWGGR